MTESDADRLRRDFLTQLDAAMSDLAHGVATEIHDGIDEELRGLDAGATATRIAQLGDPGTIAREAKAEVPAAAPVIVAASASVPRSTQKVPVVDTRGYAIASALVFAFGGFVVPVLGWFVGAVLVSSSTLWRRWEKTVAIVLPLAVGLLIVALTWGGSMLASAGQAADQENTPLVPSGLGLWHSGILLAFLVIPVTGGWLLWRLRRR